jgi:hypothetical protein
LKLRSGTCGVDAVRAYVEVAGYSAGIEVAVVIASFNARWPEAPMRKPTLPELVHLVTSAIRQDIQTASKRSVRPGRKHRRRVPTRSAGS